MDLACFRFKMWTLMIVGFTHIDPKIFITTHI